MTHFSRAERFFAAIVLTLVVGCNALLDNPRGNLVKANSTDYEESGGAVQQSDSETARDALLGSGGIENGRTPSHFGGASAEVVHVEVTDASNSIGGNSSKFSNSQGGNAIGGNAIGGNATGGNAIGGNATGGNAIGGNATGGNAIGGNAIGGNAIGGNAIGGNATGGTRTSESSQESFASRDSKSCEIGLVLYSSGSVNPSNHCMICDPSRSTSKWVLLSEGARCDPAKVCASNSCEPGCYIDSKYVKDGTPNPDNPCESCQGALLTSGWSKEPTENCVSAISSGPGHSCAVVGGKAYCWGTNFAKQLGNAAATTRSTTPILVDGLSSGVTAVSAGTYHSCAIVRGGVKCWGTDRYGSLGVGYEVTDPIGPTQVEGLIDAVSVISASNFHTCAVVEGNVKCWGDNSLGQLGNDVTYSSRVPFQVGGLVNVATDVAAGFDTGGGESFSCAVFAGSVVCWGAGDIGQLGTGQSQRSTRPVQAIGLRVGATSVTLGWTHGCALVVGDIYCWGFNRVGQIGVSPNSSIFEPTKVNGLPGPATMVSVNRNYSCAIVNGQIYCWGTCNNNSHPELPIQVNGLPDGVTTISSGENHTCAISNGSAYCWGENSNGQLGTGNYASSSDPVKLSFM
jgi:alpha-tubulin suppressor-like RCC1 family protein